MQMLESLVGDLEVADGGHGMTQDLCLLAM